MANRTMKKKVIKQMGTLTGHQEIAAWDTDTVTPERLLEIEAEYNELTHQGWWAADITVDEKTNESKNVIIKKFDPNADILLMPLYKGGRN